MTSGPFFIKCCFRAGALTSGKMASGKLLMLIALATCIEYSQQLQARKCHYRANLFYPIKHCARDLHIPQCERGVIFVQWVKHENDNCNWPCSGSCCQFIEDDASEDVRRNVVQECNNTKSCSLTSITYGTATVEYTCKESSTTHPRSPAIPSTPSITTMADSPALEITTGSASNSTTATVTDPFTEGSWFAGSGNTTPSINSPLSGREQESLDKENDIPIEVVIAVAIVVAVCLVSVPAVIILCRRHTNRTQQRKPNEIELDASPVASHSQSARTQDETGEANDNSNLLYDNVHAPPSQQVSETGNEYNTTAEVLANAKTHTDNEYDHLDHRKGKFTGKIAFEGSSANSMENVYDETQHSGAHVFTEKSTHNMDNVYDTAHDVASSVIGAKLGNSMDNMYDTTKHAANNVVIGNCMNNVYDTTQKTDKSAGDDGEGMYDTTHATFQELLGNADNTYGNVSDTGGRALGYQNDFDASDGKESAESRNQTAQESLAVNGNYYSDDTYANLS